MIQVEDYDEGVCGVMQKKQAKEKEHSETASGRIYQALDYGVSRQV